MRVCALWPRFARRLWRTPLSVSPPCGRLASATHSSLFRPLDAVAVRAPAGGAKCTLVSREKKLSGEAKTGPFPALCSRRSRFRFGVSIVQAYTCSPVRCPGFFYFYRITINAVPSQNQLNILFGKLAFGTNGNRFNDILHFFKLNIDV